MERAMEIWRDAVRRAAEQGAPVELRLRLDQHRDRFLVAWPSGRGRLLQAPELIGITLYERLDRLLREGWRVDSTRSLPAPHTRGGPPSSVMARLVVSSRRVTRR